MRYDKLAALSNEALETNNMINTLYSLLGATGGSSDSPERDAIVDTIADKKKKLNLLESRIKREANI